MPDVVLFRDGAEQARAAVNLLGPHSGATLRTVPLGPHRETFFDTNSYWKRRLPDTDRPIYLDPTRPGETSANVVSSVCKQMGFSDVPGTTTSVYLPGTPNQGLAWLGREDQHLYIVPPDQPYRPFTNITVATWATRFNQLIGRLGGLPVPLDATAHKTTDKYLHIYKPDVGLFASLYACQALDPATVALSTEGTPSSGGVTLRLWYGDHQLDPAWYTTAPIPFDASAAQVDAAVDAATSSAGAALGAGNANRCVAAGGPLNVAPVVLTFAIATPLESVRTEVVANGFDRGNPTVVLHPSGPLDRCRGGGIICAQPDGYPGVPAHPGTYRNRTVSGVFWEDDEFGAAASGMEFMAGVPSYDEYAQALADRTDLGHSVVLNVGHCQLSPLSRVWPAIRSDGDRANSPGYVCEGAHLAVRAGFDWSWHEANYPEWMPMLRTLENYGCRVPDKTGAGCALNLRRASWAGSDFNPWREMLTRYATHGSAASHLYMKAVPWADMEAIDPEWSR